MALVFLGRVGVEHYIEDADSPDGMKDKDGKPVKVQTSRTRPEQQFSSGVMIFREEIPARVSQGWEDVVDKDKKPLLNSDGSRMRREISVDGVQKIEHRFGPLDIGKPYDKFKDEADILKRYSHAFKKV